MPRLASAFVSGDAAAAAQFGTVSSLIDALRLAGHFAGGLWVVGLSVFALQERTVHPAIAWAGVIVGGILAANPIVPALLNLSFMTLPMWVIAFGIAVSRLDVAAPRGASAAAVTANGAAQI